MAVDRVQRKSFTNATGYILNVLLSSQNKHHKRENWRNLFSEPLLFAITANTPASNGKISLQVWKEIKENAVKIAINTAMLTGPVTHAHLSFLEKRASIMALSPQAIALIGSFCIKKYATQQL